MNRPRYADVAATLALVLALGGTAAYAADQLPKNSVGKKQIKPSAVNGKKIKNGAIKAKDLDASSVTAIQLADNAVSSRKIANGGILAGDLAPGSVGAGAIADGSVGLGDLTGARGASSVNYGGIAPGQCGASFSIAAPGATPGQNAFLSLGNVDPGSIVFGAVRVNQDNVSSRVCNLGANPTAGNATMTVRVVTLG